jgi:predicted DNA-binding transcriptional regulator YafY
MITQQIQRAIEEKRLLSFTYSRYPRTVEPHVLGVIDHKKQLLAYQVGGSSSGGPGSLPDWRKFDLPKIGGLTVLDETFAGPRPTPTGQHVEYDQILAIVSPGWLG